MLINFFLQKNLILLKIQNICLLHLNWLFCTVKCQMLQFKFFSHQNWKWSSSIFLHQYWQHWKWTYNVVLHCQYHSISKSWYQTLFSFHTLATLTILFSIFAQIHYCHLSKGFAEEWYFMNINTLLIWRNISWFAISARKVLQKSILLLVFRLKLKNSIGVEHFWIFTMLGHFSMRLWAGSKVSQIKACSFFLI